MAYVYDFPPEFDHTEAPKCVCNICKCPAHHHCRVRPVHEHYPSDMVTSSAEYRKHDVTPHSRPRGGQQTTYAPEEDDRSFEVTSRSMFTPPDKYDRREAPVAHIPVTPENRDFVTSKEYFHNKKLLPVRNSLQGKSSAESMVGAPVPEDFDPDRYQSSAQSAYRKFDPEAYSQRQLPTCPQSTYHHSPENRDFLTEASALKKIDPSCYHTPRRGQEGPAVGLSPENRDFVTTQHAEYVRRMIHKCPCEYMLSHPNTAMKEAEDGHLFYSGKELHDLKSKLPHE